ncbi:PhzF family phenazine biosynthesis protein [bacterium]|nr:PhzF family phenazine biosynthesis protein [bacterium]
METIIHFVDVFARQRYSGNPLAVVICAKVLSDDTMQAIASEINFSETTFVRPDPEDNGGYFVKMFTPAREVAFAGHAILGTAWVIRRHVAQSLSDTVTLNLSIGPVHVTGGSNEKQNEVWFEAPSITIGETCPAESMAAALHLSAEDIDAKAPVCKMSAGTSAMIVPLRSIDALYRSTLDLPLYAGLAGRGFPPLIYLFCNQTRDPENNLSARFFFEANGVREDPATGNGAAFLAAYLLHYNFFPDPDLYLRIEQGHALGRPSLVMVKAHKSGHYSRIAVGGSVIPIMEGKLL